LFALTVLPKQNMFDCSLLRCSIFTLVVVGTVQRVTVYELSCKLIIDKMSQNKTRKQS